MSKGPFIRTALLPFAPPLTPVTSTRGSEFTCILQLCNGVIKTKGLVSCCNGVQHTVESDFWQSHTDKSGTTAEPY